MPISFTIYLSFALKNTRKLRGAIAAPVLLVLLPVGCQEQSAPATSSTETPATAAAVPEQACYQQVIGRDTISVHIVRRGAVVTGELDVRPAEKDRARGPFQGMLKGTELVVDWQRAGEGSTQVHELVFTLAGDTLRWKEGERELAGGKWILTNPTRSYEYVLGKVDCIARH
jgi:hypothetical protein